MEIEQSFQLQPKPVDLSTLGLSRVDTSKKPVSTSAFAAMLKRAPKIACKQKDIAAALNEAVEGIDDGRTTPLSLAPISSPPISVVPAGSNADDVDGHAPTIVPSAPTITLPGPFGVKGADKMGFSTSFLEAQDTSEKVREIAQDYHDRVFVATLGAKNGTVETGLTHAIKKRMHVDGGPSLRPVMEYKKMVDESLHAKAMNFGRTVSAESTPNWEAAVTIIEALAKGKVVNLDAAGTISTDASGNVLYYDTDYHRNGTEKKLSQREIQLRAYYALKAQNLNFEQIRDLVFNKSTIQEKDKTIARFSEIAFGTSQRAPEVRSGSAISQAQFEGKNEEQLLAYTKEQILKHTRSRKPNSAQIHFPQSDGKPEIEVVVSSQPPKTGFKENLKQKKGPIGWLARKLF